MPKNRKLTYKLLIVVSFITFFVNKSIVFAANTIDCDEIPKTIEYIQNALGMVKIVIPILLILLGTIDFVKAIAAQNDDKIKQAQNDFVKRLIIGVIIFFVPMILRFILDIAGFGNSCLTDLISF